MTCLARAACALLLVLAIVSSSDAAGQTYRMHDGVTAFVVNHEAKAFSVSLDIRDLNMFEEGPREVLVKVYDPDGHTVVREVIPDDGITEPAYQHPAGAWDHEAWYYAWTRMQGEAPMIRWSTFSDPARLATIAKRTFTWKIPAGKSGVYRVLLVGSTDHYVTLNIDPDLPYGISGNATFLHAHGDMLERSHIYVPRGAKGLHVVTAEWDQPATRLFKLTAPDGKVLFETDGTLGFVRQKIEFDQPGQYDDQLLLLEVTPVPTVPSDHRRRVGRRDRKTNGDFLIEIKHRFDKDPEVTQRGERAYSAVFAPDEATAKAIQGGAIYHDDRVFWHGCQVRLYDWLKTLGDDDFVVKNKDGQPIKVNELPQRKGFIPLNSNYWRSPLCDTVMFQWLGHRNRAALNLAIRDLIAGLRSLGPNDHVAVAVGGPFANMGYEFSNYAWHYWRPGWRIIQQSDAPEELKKLLKDAFLVAGDRLAFCRSWARVNGNSFALIPHALRYCMAATGDPLQKELFEPYFDLFENGGWGERVGVGPSGSIQEGFAYAYHYGSYAVRTYMPVIDDFKDERFKRVNDRLRNWFSYTLSEKPVAAGPWSSRTHFYPHTSIQTEGPFRWKGFPGPDFTVSVNEGDEWFAARRKNYYALTYHGRLSPKWNSNANAGNCGYGGGMLCQLHIPGRGPVLASTLNGDYGRGMDPSQWRTFHLHSLVGTSADGRALVAADSEHFNARLDGTTVIGDGPVRDTSLHVTRSVTFGPNDIRLSVKLDQSRQLNLLNLWTQSKLHGRVTEAYEMIPYVGQGVRRSGKKIEPTAVTLLNAAGQSAGEFTPEPVVAKTIVIDRGGFGVRIELPEARRIQKGENSTVLIELARELIPAAELSFEYRLVPFAHASTQ